MVLCDTDVIIEILKGNQPTLDKINSIGINNFSISSVTIMELYFGALHKRELKTIKKSLNSLQLVHFSHEISKISIDLMENYSKSHGLRIPDAIIAASAISLNHTLFTYNIKDFKYIRELELYPA